MCLRAPIDRIFILKLFKSLRSFTSGRQPRSIAVARNVLSLLDNFGQHYKRGIFTPGVRVLLNAICLLGVSAFSIDGNFSFKVNIHIWKQTFVYYRIFLDKLLKVWSIMSFFTYPDSYFILLSCVFPLLFIFNKNRWQWPLSSLLSFTKQCVWRNSWQHSSHLSPGWQAVVIQ